MVYFLINTLTGEQKSNLVSQCVAKLIEIGLIVTSLTFDGLSSNASIVKLLGSNLQNLTADSHCTLSGQKFFTYFDPCHSIKLVRNTFGKKKIS